MIKYRSVNYINEIIINNNSIKSIVINKEKLINYFNELACLERFCVILRLIIPANDNIKKIINNLWDIKFKSITHVKNYDYVSMNTVLYDIDDCHNRLDKIENIKTLRTDIFKGKIDSFMEILIKIYDIRRNVKGG